MWWTDEPAQPSAPVTVALHGAPGSVYDWRYLGGALAGRARLIRMDLPGHGRTLELPGDAVHVDAYASLVGALLRHIGVWPQQRVVLVAHSLGAPLAMRLAASHPESVTGIVLAAPVSLQRHRGVEPWPVVQALGRALQVPVAGRWVVQPFLHQLYTRGLGFNPKYTSAHEVAVTHRRVCALDFALAARDALAIRCVPWLCGCDPKRLHVLGC